MTWDATLPSSIARTAEEAQSARRWHAAAQQPGMFNQATWDAVASDLPSLPSMSDLTQPFEKLSEIGSQIKWGATKIMDGIGNTLFGSSASTPGHMISGALGGNDAINNMIPESFKALTNGSMSTVTENAIKDFGNTLGFDSFKSGFFGDTVGATDVSSMLSDAGIAAGVGGPTRKEVTLVSTVTGETVTFKVTPTISEERSATYDEVSPAHHPGSIMKYSRTASRGWGIGQAKLISRNVAEATENQKTLNLLRSWLMPYYGYGTEAEDKNRLGAPPDVLTFTAYGDKNIGGVPVVITSLNVSWPNDVDYIHTADMQAFPVIMNIDISLKEAWSPREYSGFSLAAYKKGDMKGAYDASRSAPNPTPSTEEPGITTTPAAVVGKDGKPGVVEIGTPAAEAAVQSELTNIFAGAQQQIEHGNNMAIAMSKIATKNEILSKKSYGRGHSNFSTNDAVEESISKAIPKAYGRGHSN